MGDGNDADHIALQPVDQRIGETVEGKRPCVVRAGFAQPGELAQQAKRSIEFIGEILCCDERAFADVPEEPRRKRRGIRPEEISSRRNCIRTADSS